MELLGEPKTKKQHYLPRFFIENFSDDSGNLSCIRRLNNERLAKPKKYKPSGICYEDCKYETMVSGENAVFPNALENQNAICEKWLSEQLKTILDAIKDKGLTKLDPPALSNTVYILTLACSWFTCRINMPVSDQEIKIAMQQNGLADSQEIKEQTAEIIKDIDVPSQLFDPDLVADLLAKTLNANPSINSPASPIREAQNGLLDCSVDVLRTYGTIPFVGADSALLSEFNSVQTVYWPVSNDIAIAFVQDGLHQFTVKSFNEADVMLFNNYLASDGYWDFLFASNEKEMTRIYSAFFL